MISEAQIDPLISLDVSQRLASLKLPILILAARPLKETLFSGIRINTNKNDTEGDRAAKK